MARIHKYPKQIPMDFEARILDADDSRLYREVLQKAKKDFSKGFQHISNNINPDKASGSNFFFVSLMDEIMGKEERIATLDDWGEMLFGGNFAEGVYFDSNQLILRSDKATWKNNQPIINDLSKKLKGEFEYSSENPIIITGAKLIPSKNKDNHYGIDLDIENAEIKNDEKFAYGKKEIQLGNIPKPLWTKKDGLSWLCLSGGGLISDDDYLVSSDSDGRVAVLNAGGVLPENFDKYSERDALEFLGISPKEYQLIKEIKKQK